MEEIDFSKVFHESSKNRQKNHPPIAQDRKNWPVEWTTTFYKDYPRLPKIHLVDAPAGGSIFETIVRRKSRRDFMRGPITKRELSLLLKYSCGQTGMLDNNRHRRAQPSAGARYPLETYLIVFRSGPELKSGLYHYNVRDHALDVLWDREFGDDESAKFFAYPWVKDATFVIVLTAVFWRNQNKYGERGYRYVLIEAGHVGQNIYLVSENLGLKCCALVGTNDKEMEKLINIDGITESVVYTVAVGR